MSNRLAVLAQRVRARPKQKLLEAQFNQLQKIAEDIQACSNEVEAAQKRASTLREVEPSAALGEIFQKQIAIIRKRAGVLIKVTCSEQVLENAEVSGALQDVKQAASALRNAISKEWTKVSSADQEQASAFLDIAKQYDEAAADRLRRALQQFSELTASPPSTDVETDRYKVARWNLLQARSELKLDGPTGVFLQACMTGNGGDPKALENVDIRAFLDRHPVLWQRLRLRLT
ncbi:hypothetical protein [Polycyclovorans algicola]|uniref:hypothetical protein n=1 Tax=Polycyclovorans algicola TaxID=616992 RepID=UPI0004A6BA64|nr:hypothetical protein [Polycyclovorans algicola]